MDRQAGLRQWYLDKLTGMKSEIAALLKSPAKYLEAALSEEPSSGVELYDRWEDVCHRFWKEFPEQPSHLVVRQYRADREGSLQRRDLISLDRDIKALQTLISQV